MWNRLLGFAIPLFLLACSESKPVEQKTTVKTKPVKEEKTEPKFFLNNENAPAFLSNYLKENPERRFVISTRYGEIEIEISEKTPVHSGNFLYLVKKFHFYDSTQFYRVAEDFIIQGGDADSYLISGRKYSVGDYALEQEIHPDLHHKVGAVAMCKNYDKHNFGLSSSFDFYIVIGDKSSELQLQVHEREKGIVFSADRRAYYKNVGGTPHLDNEHTVFGQVVSGMDVVRKISEVSTDSQDWPEENIFMKVRIK